MRSKDNRQQQQQQQQQPAAPQLRALRERRDSGNLCLPSIVTSSGRSSSSSKSEDPLACSDASRSSFRSALSSDSCADAVAELADGITRLASPRAPSPLTTKMARRLSANGDVHCASTPMCSPTMAPPSPSRPRLPPIESDSSSSSSSSSPGSSSNGLKRRRAGAPAGLSVEVPLSPTPPPHSNSNSTKNNNNDTELSGASTFLSPQTPASARPQWHGRRSRPPPLSIGSAAPPEAFGQSPEPAHTAASARQQQQQQQQPSFSAPPSLAAPAAEPGVSEIVPGLFIGSLSALSRCGGGPANGLAACLQMNNITAVIDCSAQRGLGSAPVLSSSSPSTATGQAPLPPHLAALPTTTALLALYMRDRATTDAAALFLPAIAFIHRALSAGDRVLVLCQRGRSRSATLVLAYLIWRQRCSYEEALAHVRAARAAVSPNVGFCMQLMSWAEDRPSLRKPRASVFAVAIADERSWERAAVATHATLAQQQQQQQQVSVPSAAGPVPELSSGMFEEPEAEEGEGPPRCWLVSAQNTQFVWHETGVSEAVLRAAEQVAALLSELEGAAASVVKVARGAETPAFWNAVRSAGGGESENGETRVSPRLQKRGLASSI